VFSVRENIVVGFSAVIAQAGPELIHCPLGSYFEQVKDEPLSRRALIVVHDAQPFHLRRVPL
jgi:hypothetical protein